MHQPEIQIISAIKNGDCTQFTELYDTYIDKIYKYLFYRTHHQQTAEDLTSQVFIKALERIHSFDHNKGEFAVWLYRIARNTLFDHTRTYRNHDELSAAQNIASASNPPGEIDQALSNDYAQTILKSLNQAEQELITMKLWDELTYAQIALITEKSESSLKMQFSRIIAKLRLTYRHEE